MHADNNQYIHGFSEVEEKRLLKQAKALNPFIHADTFFPSKSKVLEVGCGVGAQTILLAQKHPEVEFMAIDNSPASIEKARQLAKAHSISNVRFEHEDIFNLPYLKKSFDHIVSSFVFEHIEKPMEALQACQAILKKGGTISLVEGEHDSVYFYPESKEMKLVWESYAKLHQSFKGDPNIGRRLYPLLKQAGFKNIQVSPCVVYMDESKPDLRKDVLEDTILAAFNTIKDDLLKHNLIESKTWDKGIEDFYSLAKSPSGVFCYTWLKAKAFT